MAGEVYQRLAHCLWQPKNIMARGMGPPPAGILPRAGKTVPTFVPGVDRHLPYMTEHYYVCDEKVAAKELMTAEEHELDSLRTLNDDHVDQLEVMVKKIGWNVDQVIRVLRTDPKGKYKVLLLS